MMIKDSTLAHLHPQDYEHPAFVYFKNSMRMQGSLHMNLRRPSRSFEFSRQYLPGDPIHMLDWKAFARTDQLILREKRDESCAHVAMIIDHGATMHWPTEQAVDHKPLPPLKLELAYRMACHIAASHLSCGDMVQLWNLEQTLCHTPKSPSDIVSLFEHIRQGQFATQEINRFLSPMIYEKSKFDLLYIFSDGLTPKSYGDFIRPYSKLCFFHVLSSLEHNISWLKDHTVYFDQDLETKEYLGQTLKMKALYQKNFDQWSDQLKNKIRELMGFYCLVDDQTEIEVYLKILDQWMAGG